MRFVTLFCIFLGISGMFSGCYQGGNSIALTKKDNGSTIEARVGDVIEISVEGNPTTGYTWEWVKDETTLLELLGEPEYSSDSDLVGSGGMYKFVFKVSGSGDGKLHLIYHRTFEPDVAPLEDFNITLQVKE